ncbi:MAG TPA: twin-arginine translocation signal domain-containing protein [Candidatus Sulfotelmatobacter sp.]|nr:twin-arginine translocation signal domain-containing protein [Candidatus Sulfotelmatobacter sp.]
MSYPCSRRAFLETSAIAGAALAGTSHLSRALAASERESSALPAAPGFPVADYHVHLSERLSIEQAVNLGKERRVQIGIVEHPGPGYKLNSDADLKQYINTLRQYPVRIGLQPVYPGWSKAFSKNLVAQLDYVLMDALTLPNPDGTYLAIWQIDTVVDDGEAFMQRYMQFIEQVMTTEAIDIFGWPTFLPAPIARRYSDLWTKPRMQRIVDLAKSKAVAIEINELAHVPDESFIRLANRASLKFTFGTDSRTPQAAAHLYYCYQMANKCGLTEADMFVPAKKS